jgi:hypothetical protein
MPIALALNAIAILLVFLVFYLFRRNRKLALIFCAPTVFVCLYVPISIVFCTHEIYFSKSYCSESIWLIVIIPMYLLPYGNPPIFHRSQK